MVYLLSANEGFYNLYSHKRETEVALRLENPINFDMNKKYFIEICQKIIIRV
jgi:hypothetical protein